MSATQESALYDELVDLLASSADADADQLRSFRLSPTKQSRLDEPVDKNREDTLTKDESDELNAFEHFEHLVRLLKARVVGKHAK